MAISAYQNGNLVTLMAGGASSTSYTFPLDMIKLDTYEVVDATLDLYDWRDSYGSLHRKVCPNKQFKCEFTTKNMLTDEEFAQLMAEIRVRYTSVEEKRLTIRAFVPETGQYVIRNVYVPDIKVKIHHADLQSRKVYYEPVRIAFIDYAGGEA